MLRARHKECSFDNETRCEEIRHQDRGVMGMWSKARVLSAVVGLSLLGVSSGAVAAIHLDVRSNQSAPLSQMPSPGSRTIVADWNEYQWRHHHHPSNVNPNDYNWGGRNRYRYPPGWFSGPPSGMATRQRRAYLEQRREAAINMQQQMLARGDTKAAERLGGVIGQLNQELGFR
jgi:hypothetical protein